ncbi:uncharacterized protein PAN0_016d5319 [Moesziomyces antarcticus]|uniref:Uncharacterized protein n=2 Tax=Pseudozyma antarctica TaxID=84753 RepID=A0A081CK97_PSEA2|nr:uncharacterized protein PAN0_016d5319 [Moesziomyces antarcticus]GAK67093.1 conserved hypothetical protein [Moesziomyces antarcticus]SPO48343.1 uncharacterized protein PSANT_06032 [Moesziomyces antarcticus]
MANLASHMTPRMDDRPAFVARPGEPEDVQEFPDVSGISTKIYHHLGVDTPFDPQHRLVTSYILPIPALSIFRIVVTIYMLFTAFVTAVQEGIGTITYFTSLSYWGDCAYFFVSAIHTCTFWYSLSRWNKARLASRGQGAGRIEMLEKAYPRNGVGRIDVARSKAAIDAFGTQLHHSIESELAYSRRTEFEIGSRYPRSWLSKSFSRPLQVCHTLLVSTVSSYPLVVMVIFWTVLKGPAPLGDSYSAFANIGKHTLNWALTMLDLVVLSRTPLRPWWHLVPILAFLGLYLGIVDITFKRYGVWVYGFFNVQQFGVPLVVFFCLLLAVFAVVSLLITQLLMLLREVVAAKVQKSGGWGSAKAVGVPDDACIPTRRGPGPLGGGGKRTKPGHDIIHLRGRFPSNALVGDRSSGIVVDDVQIHALSMVGSELNVDEVKTPISRSTRPSIRFEGDDHALAPSRSRSRQADLPNADASSSEAHLFRLINWRAEENPFASNDRIL